MLYFHRQFSQIELMALHQLADFCVVSSLHDGMNLVAKEFVASRNDDQGVLVLSRFAGAAVELSDALVFNPYDLDQTREAMRSALEMDPAEARRRMQKLREAVVANNVYRWAGKFLSTLSRLEVADEYAVAACPTVF